MPKSECKTSSSSSCGARTINLAKEGLSLDDRRTKMLIYEKKYPTPPFCGARLPTGVKSTPKSAKKIRVCTAADLKNTCPPPLCTCPPYNPLTFWGLIKRGISFGTRAAIVGAVVWWTYDIGLWGPAAKTERLYVQMKNSVLHRHDEDEGLQDGSPRMDRAFHSGREKWNYAVAKSFQLVTAVSNKITSVMAPEREDCQPPAGSTKAKK